jgi:WD40 repeat protein
MLSKFFLKTASEEKSHMFLIRATFFFMGILFLWFSFFRPLRSGEFSEKKKGPGLERNLVGHNSDIWFVSFSPDGTKILSCGGEGRLGLGGGLDRTIRIWDVKSGKELIQLKGHRRRIYCADYSPDESLVASAGYDRTIRIWDLKKKKEIRKLSGHTSAIRCLKFLSDGKDLLSGSEDGTLRLWNVNGDLVKTAHFFADKYDNSKIYLPTVVSVLLWPITGKWITGIDPPFWWKDYYWEQGFVVSMAISRDEKKLLISCWDKTARLIDLPSMRQVWSFQGDSKQVESVAISADGLLGLAAGSDGKIRLWDLANRKEKACFVGHKTPVYSIAFSPDGKRILSGSGWVQLGLEQDIPVDCTVRLWDVVSGKELCRFCGHSYEIRSVAFSPDGKRAVSSSVDQTIRVWRLPP